MLRLAPDGALLLDVRVVPGASRDAIAGVHGERLKVRVAAPPEDGKANRALCALIAAALGVRQRQVVVAVGATAPEKTLRVEGYPGTVAAARNVLLGAG